MVKLPAPPRFPSGPVCSGTARSRDFCASQRDACLYRRRSGGIAYIALLVYVSIIATALLTAVILWSETVRRAKEASLLRAGAEIRRAIGTYYEHSPGSVKRYPASLDDLLEDKRYLTLIRHLRRIYRDPITLETHWGLVRSPDGAIMGVYSLSDQKPVKQAHFPMPFGGFDGAAGYSQWRFVYEPVQVSGARRASP
jgi:type II secretory pathway pseudopilin PulG